MLTTDTTLNCSNTFSCLISNRNGSKHRPTLAMKKESKPLFPLKRPNNTRIIFQSAIGVFALGFIDAGYSGDWSRIGAISRGTEDLLKAGAFLVVPLCIFLIFSLSKNDVEE